MLKSIRNGFASDAEDFFENNRIDDNYWTLGKNIKFNLAIGGEVFADAVESFS